MIIKYMKRKKKHPKNIFTCVLGGKTGVAWLGMHVRVSELRNLKVIHYEVYTSR